MFEKHTTTLSTGGMYEKPGVTGYFRIWEIENGRYIDEDKYVPWLNWAGTPDEINIDPAPSPEPVSTGPTDHDLLIALATIVEDMV